MTAAERAKGLRLGEPVECPRCDTLLRVDHNDLGTVVSCAGCGYRSSAALAGIIGKPGDGTAAIHLELED